MVALKMSFLHFAVNIVLHLSALQIIYSLHEIVAILTQYIEDVLFHIITKISAITFLHERGTYNLENGKFQLHLKETFYGFQFIHPKWNHVFSF